MREGGGIELILLNATREPLQRGVAQQLPFVPEGNKRCFHPRDVVKLLSRAPPSPTVLVAFCIFQPSPLNPFTLSSSILSQIFPNSASHTGFAKMIYDRLRSLSSLSPPFLFARSSRGNTCIISGLPECTAHPRKIPI